VFFEAVVPLGPMDTARALDLLLRRGATDVLSEAATSAVLESHDGTPRHLIRLARGHLTSNAEDGLRHAHEHADAIAQLRSGARRLLSEMQGRGPVAATNAELHKRLGVTDRQIRRSLKQLEQAGLVEAVPGARPGPGRPPKTYGLTELGRVEVSTA